MNRWPVTWWEFTGAYTPFVNGSAQPFMRNMVTGALAKLHDLPFGACYVANRNPETLKIERCEWIGADGLSIVCITPRTSPPDPKNIGQWYIDSRANNCTMKDDWTHRCWVRHGTVGDPLSIDKDGKTCAAGAGSIQNAGWHGFLKDGWLHE